MRFWNGWLMPRRRGGLYLPLDVNFMDDPLVMLVGEQAAWLYVCMCLRSKSLLSDGVLTEQQIERLVVPQWKRRLKALTTVTDSDGRTLVMDITSEGDAFPRYWITGWFKHNASASQVDAERSKDALRKATEREAKQRIFERDGYRCRYCGRSENLTLDHIKPLYLGGGGEDSNLQALCKSCNSRKGKRDGTGLAPAEARALFRITGHVSAVLQPSGEQVEESREQESTLSTAACEHSNPVRFCHLCKMKSAETEGAA